MQQLSQLHSKILESQPMICMCSRDIQLQRVPTTCICLQTEGPKHTLVTSCAAPGKTLLHLVHSALMIGRKLVKQMDRHTDWCNALTAIVTAII